MEVASTDRGMDSGAGGLLLNPKNGDLEMLGHRGEDSGDTAELGKKLTFEGLRQPALHALPHS